MRTNCVLKCLFMLHRHAQNNMFGINMPDILSQIMKITEIANISCVFGRGVSHANKKSGAYPQPPCTQQFRVSPIHADTHSVIWPPDTVIRTWRTITIATNCFHPICRAERLRGAHPNQPFWRRRILTRIMRYLGTYSTMAQLFSYAKIKYAHIKW